MTGLDSAVIRRPAMLYTFQAGDTYTISLETPDESPSVLAGTVSVSAADRQDVLAACARVMGMGALPESFEPTALPSVGRLMYGLFLPRAIQDFLRTWQGPLIISTTDPAIPWELLHDGRTFLGIKDAVGRRLVSARTPPLRADIRRAQPTFLFVADPRGDLEGAAEESRHLVATLSRRGLACDLLLAERASYLNVQAALGSGRYDVIHYAGHAHFGAGDSDESTLELAQGRMLPASQIERVLRGAPLIFLNACSSAYAGFQDTTERALTNLGVGTESLAAAFIFGGAQAFIGALWPVSDAASQAFAAYFYERCLAGDPVGEALRATRQHLSQEQPAHAIWAAFVLYGDPTYRLWKNPAAAESTKSIASAAPVRQAGEILPISTPGMNRAGRPPASAAVEGRGRLRGVLGVITTLIVAGLLGTFGWWAYGRLPRGTEREAVMTPAVEAAVLATDTPSAQRPVGQPSTTPTTSPTPRPTATALAIVQRTQGRLAFVSKSEAGLSTVYVMNAGGSGVRVLGLGADPDWSPEGDRIAYAGLLEGEPGIHLINLDGNGHTRLTDVSDWQPTWSPDGDRLAFMSLRDGDREIYVINADGGGLRRISNNPWQDKHPSWSPAGERIAFISNRSGRWQVWVMNADGSNQVRLTHNDSDNFRPVWSPDGRQIAFGVWTGSRNEIWVMDADGGNPHVATTNAVYKQEFEGYGLAWEPNRVISFVSNRSGPPQIYVMAPDGSGQTAVTNMPAGAFSPAWAPR